MTDEYLFKLKELRLKMKTQSKAIEYDFDLKREFREWDSLSDEALLNFEGTL